MLRRARHVHVQTDWKTRIDLLGHRSSRGVRQPGSHCLIGRGEPCRQVMSSVLGGTACKLPVDPGPKPTDTGQWKARPVIQYGLGHTVSATSVSFFFRPSNQPHQAMKLWLVQAETERPKDSGWPSGLPPHRVLLCSVFVFPYGCLLWLLFRSCPWQRRWTGLRPDVPDSMSRRASKGLAWGSSRRAREWGFSLGRRSEMTSSGSLLGLHIGRRLKALFVIVSAR